MNRPSLQDIEDSAQVVYRDFAATPQYAWPLLTKKLATTCWLKHENHTPVGAFKIRSSLTYFEQLARNKAVPAEVISATRGNHSQSIDWAARAHGVRCTSVAPLSNSVEKKCGHARHRCHRCHADRTWHGLPRKPCQRWTSFTCPLAKARARAPLPLLLPCSSAPRSRADGRLGFGRGQCRLRHLRPRLVGDTKSLKLSPL
jgi:hypothetical protein